MLGDVELELIQPVAGDSLYRDHIYKHGEGISHLAFVSDNVEETMQLMEAEGFSCVQYGKTLPDSAYAYFDTLGPLKVYWETFKPPSTVLPISARYPA
jgi:4-hydroxyphenylpyruvate dioxygenase-like putative hemolysin